jgi:large subunit ribosomal protein L9
MGQTAERVFGKKNFLELYAVFSSPVLYKVQTATKKELDRRDILVPEIHRTGSYKVQIKLHPEVTAEVNLEVASY